MRAEDPSCGQTVHADRLVVRRLLYEGQMHRLVPFFVIVGCKAFPAPPMIAMHSDTSAAPEGTTTLVLVAGFAGTLFGGGGWGLALRGERQVTTRTTLGLEVTGGWGNEGRRKGEQKVNHSLYALRGYGRWTPRTHDWTAATYSAGISHFDTGLVTGTIHAGTAFSYVNDFAAPVLQLGIAGAIPLVDGESFGDPDLGSTQPRPDVFLCIDAGVVGLVDEGQNRFSFDLAYLHALRARELVIGLSAADAQRFD
jgi:hypothetical protein